jgi:fatty acid-binding protein DegV
MLCIVTDGALDLPPEWEEEIQIDVVPINVQFVEKTYSC